MFKPKWQAAVAVAGVTALALAGCSSSTTQQSSSKGGEMTVGTTDKIVSLDPAASYDNGSLFVMSQVYPFLMNSKPGSATPEPDIATSAKFTNPTTFTVKLKKGLKFANGDKLTSSDVKFSFDRQTAIADPNGPSSLLGNLKSTDAPNPTTVKFHLKTKNDQTWPGVLTSAAGPIVDEQVLSKSKVTSDNKIVEKKAFAGPYQIASYKKNNLVSYKKFDGYKGILGAPKTATVNMKYYSDPTNMKLDVDKGGIDVAYRTLGPTDIQSLSKKKNLKIHKGPGGELRYIVFDYATMPFGTKSDNPNPKKALAVRQAMADSVDRAKIAKQVYKGTESPVYSAVPNGFLGSASPMKSMYGDGHGGPDVAKAKKTLKSAGITKPVELHIQYNSDHYGASSSDEYAMVKSQLESTGLFKVNLQSTEWDTYQKDRVKDVYPMYQLGWYPDFSDADNYLTPFFLNDKPGQAFLQNHYRSTKMNKLIHQESSQPNKAKRKKEIIAAQKLVAKQLPILPLLQGAQVAVANKDVSGVTLDASFKFRLGTLHK